MSPVLLLAIALSMPNQQPDRLVVPDVVGVNVHEQSPYFNYSEGQNHRMFDFGFRVVRIGMAWADAQITPNGRWHMDGDDEFVKQTVEAGLRPLILVDYNNFKLTGGVSPDTPEKIAAFDRFVEVCVRRYQKFNPIWEIGNEPTHKSFWAPKPNAEDYTKLVIATAKTIKDVDPNAVVCAGSLFAVDEDFLQTFVREGGLAFLDDISLHPYEHHAPESALKFYRHVQQLIKSQGLDHRVGIMVTEWGYAEDWKAISRARAAEYYPRMVLVNLMAGLDLSIFYEWSDRGEETVSSSFFGLLDTANEPKPAYGALHSLLQQLKGYRLQRFRANGVQHEYVMVFTKGDSTRVVGWIANHDAEDLDPSVGDPRTFEDPPVQVEFEGKRLTLASMPKVFEY